MQRLQVQLTDVQLARLRRVAAERGVSIAALIRESVEAHLERPGADARRRAVDSLGGFRSGRGDVADRHDDYLAQDLA